MEVGRVVCVISFSINEAESAGLKFSLVLEVC